MCVLQHACACAVSGRSLTALRPPADHAELWGLFLPRLLDQLLRDGG
jgi:hypothetical protein